MGHKGHKMVQFSGHKIGPQNEAFLMISIGRSHLGTIFGYLFWLPDVAFCVPVFGAQDSDVF